MIRRNKVAEVKWIKIVTDIFDDEKMLLIESMPEADSIIVIWFKLLCLAGKINNSGVLILNEKIPFTDEMLSTIFRRPLNTVRLAIRTFENFEMIETINNVLFIPNWDKHQNLNQLEAKKKYMRTYMKKRRDNQKMIACGEELQECKTNSKANSKANVSKADIDIELDIEVDKDIERDIDIIDVGKINFNNILIAWNDLPGPIKPIKAITEIRKNKIKARINSLKLKEEDIITAINNIKASDFLQGKSSNWIIEFDWLFKDDTRFSKVLEGAYANKENISKDNYNKNVQAGLDLVKKYAKEENESEGKSIWDV
jgi:predicted phage replisome organizer